MSTFLVSWDLPRTFWTFAQMLHGLSTSPTCLRKAMRLHASKEVIIMKKGETINRSSRHQKVEMSFVILTTRITKPPGWSWKNPIDSKKLPNAHSPSIFAHDPGNIVGDWQTSSNFFCRAWEISSNSSRVELGGHSCVEPRRHSKQSMNKKHMRNQRSLLNMVFLQFGPEATTFGPSQPYTGLSNLSPVLASF